MMPCVPAAILHMCMVYMHARHDRSYDGTALHKVNLERVHKLKDVWDACVLAAM